MVAERRLEWRSTALDLPLALLIVLVLGQLALGNRPLVGWALAPAGAPDLLPSVFLALGTVAPAHTARALLLLLTYAGAYLLVVHLVRTRAQLDRLVSTLLAFGGLLAFLGLLDYLGREAWLLRWRGPATGRLSGTFVNPDHFAAWLAMLICLGVGYLLARRPSGRGARSLIEVLRSREGRERVARQYLPFVALVTMTVALVFTLSRGAIVSLLFTVLILLLVLHALGRIRWSLVCARGAPGRGAGLRRLDRPRAAADPGPAGGLRRRLIQGLTTLPMLRTFPLLGVGLGAYGDIYPRYQPLALAPGKAAYPYAHDDLLQLAVELGAIGAVLIAWMGWRVGKDLLGAHLLGRAACPVGGGEREGAQRRDPFSVGLGVGAVGSVLALLVHSVFDFAARIPANGILAAACLGIATVALHTRFQATGDRLLVKSRVASLAGRSGLALALGLVAIVVSLAAVPWIVRPAVVAAPLQAAERPGTDRGTALRRVEAALALDARDERALALRGRLRLAATVELWNSGLAPDGQVLTSLDERRQAGLVLVGGAKQDFETALVAGPVRLPAPRRSSPRLLGPGAARPRERRPPSGRRPGLLLARGRAGSREPVSVLDAGGLRRASGRALHGGRAPCGSRCDRARSGAAGRSRRPVSPASPQRSAVGGDGSPVGDRPGRARRAAGRAAASRASGPGLPERHRGGLGRPGAADPLGPGPARAPGAATP